ncbi:hypothetical protein OGATHE_003606 [Ogataea polymorpha]|uniref:Uncharacterized protein n=1 Tax=Ogataea polymorpha TaxID=460523 RepID=A0A9P8T4F2_9ASCO|nr:hypothetical protein OGATHE_003606 [Ogataea polymorpha]
MFDDRAVTNNCPLPNVRVLHKHVVANAATAANHRSLDLGPVANKCVVAYNNSRLDFAGLRKSDVLFFINMLAFVSVGLVVNDVALRNNRIAPSFQNVLRDAVVSLPALNPRSCLVVKIFLENSWNLGSAYINVAVNEIVSDIKLGHILQYFWIDIHRRFLAVNWRDVLVIQALVCPLFENKTRRLNMGSCPVQLRSLLEHHGGNIVSVGDFTLLVDCQNLAEIQIGHDVAGNENKISSDQASGVDISYGVSDTSRLQRHDGLNLKIKCILGLLSELLSIHDEKNWAGNQKYREKAKKKTCPVGVHVLEHEGSKQREDSTKRGSQECVRSHGRGGKNQVAIDDIVHTWNEDSHETETGEETRNGWHNPMDVIVVVTCPSKPQNTNRKGHTTPDDGWESGFWDNFSVISFQSTNVTFLMVDTETTPQDLANHHSKIWQFGNTGSHFVSFLEDKWVCSQKKVQHAVDESIVHTDEENDRLRKKHLERSGKIVLNDFSDTELELVVGSMNTPVITTFADARMPVMNSVHLQPRLELATIKPPMNGASNGPTNTAIENTTIAVPLVRLPNMSAKPAGATTIGAAPKQPAKNLQIKIDSSLSEHATAKLKAANATEERSITGLLPYNSDRGAQTTGPVAKPRTYRVIPSVATTGAT